MLSRFVFIALTIGSSEMVTVFSCRSVISVIRIYAAFSSVTFFKAHINNRAGCLWLSS